MAIGRLSMKVGTAGKARPHAAYIAREGQYTGRFERGEKLEATEAGNMPAWAQSNPQAFWQAADAFERKNGTTYREMEIALPRELSAAECLALTREFVRLEIGDRHAYQFAIHCPAAVDGQEQPHVHLMFSERQRDGIERDPEQYFKRYNAKAPEKGGCRKGYGPSAGQTLTKAERVAELKELRGRWAAMCNAHLERAGVEQRIDMRSNAERGIGLEPERKQLPSQWRGQGRANVIEFRQARAELARAVPDAAAEILRLEQDRKRAEPNHELRRGSDGLTAEQPAVPQRPQAERAAPDPLAGFRAVIERAEADDDWLALDVAKAQLAVAQEFQADREIPPAPFGGDHAGRPAAGLCGPGAAVPGKDRAGQSGQQAKPGSHQTGMAKREGAAVHLDRESGQGIAHPHGGRDGTPGREISEPRPGAACRTGGPVRWVQEGRAWPGVSRLAGRAGRVGKAVDATAKPPAPDRRIHAPGRPL